MASIAEWLRPLRGVSRAGVAVDRSLGMRWRPGASGKSGLDDVSLKWHDMQFSVDSE